MGTQSGSLQLLSTYVTLITEQQLLSTGNPSVGFYFDWKVWGFSETSLHALSNSFLQRFSEQNCFFTYQTYFINKVERVARSEKWLMVL